MEKSRLARQAGVDRELAEARARGHLDAREATPQEVRHRLERLFGDMLTLHLGEKPRVSWKPKGEPATQTFMRREVERTIASNVIVDVYARLQTAEQDIYALRSTAYKSEK